MTEKVTDNKEKKRFELKVDELTVFADYRREGETMYITHVEAPPKLRGTGAAGHLMEGLMLLLKEERVKVVPTCSYAAAWMARHAKD